MRLLPRLALVLALLGPPLAAQGRIVLLNKERKPVPQTGVLLVAETLEQVRFTTANGAEVTRRTADVSEIDPGQGSESFEQGLAALAAGDVLKAEALFAAASHDEAPPWVAAHALLRQAEAAAGRGSSGLQPALAALGEFVQRFPEHRLLPQARLQEATCAALAGDAPRARAALDAILALAQESRITPDWTVRAHLADGDALLLAHDGAGAVKAFAAAETAARVPPEVLVDRPDLEPALTRLALQARVGTGSALLENGDLPAARACHERLARDAGDDPALQAAAANGLAECLYREPDGLKAAQLAFARVAVEAADVPVERARALYFLGRCAGDLGQAGREPDGQEKAQACFEEVVARYPATRWAAWVQQAQQSLR